MDEDMEDCGGGEWDNEDHSDDKDSDHMSDGEEGSSSFEECSDEEIASAFKRMHKKYSGKKQKTETIDKGKEFLLRPVSEVNKQKALRQYDIERSKQQHVDMTPKPVTEFGLLSDTTYQSKKLKKSTNSDTPPVKRVCFADDVNNKLRNSIEDMFQKREVKQKIVLINPDTTNRMGWIVPNESIPGVFTTMPNPFCTILYPLYISSREQKEYANLRKISGFYASVITPMLRLIHVAVNVHVRRMVRNLLHSDPQLNNEEKLISLRTIVQGVIAMHLLKTKKVLPERVIYEYEDNVLKPYVKTAEEMSKVKRACVTMRDMYTSKLK
jgi:hypothetical protein